jgi:hypothetical protein
MIITEADIAPYRRKSGITEGEMPFRGLEARQAGTSGVQKLFTPSSKLLKDELFNSDNTTGDTLEIALFLAYTASAPILRDGYQWLAVDHQAGGIATRPFLFIGIRLEPRAEIYRPLRQIARKWWFAESGALYPERVTARHIGAYSRALEDIGLDCDFSYPHLMESVYPIDAVQPNLDRVAENAPSLKDIAGVNGGQRENKNLIIVAITENSD